MECSTESYVPRRTFLFSFLCYFCDVWHTVCVRAFFFSRGMIAFTDKTTTRGPLSKHSVNASQTYLTRVGMCCDLLTERPGEKLVLCPTTNCSRL